MATRGVPIDALRLWIAGVRSGVVSALAELDRVADWRPIPPKILDVLAARPYASAEAAAVSSRDTAERTLRTFERREIVRAINGRGRFRL